MLLAAGPLAVAGSASALPSAPAAGVPGPVALPDPRLLVDRPAWQIRIEQRVIIRIRGGPGANPRALSDLRRPIPLPPADQKWHERPMGKCVATADLVGVRIEQPTSLDLIMRDGSAVRAYLEDGCEAREFYSGFYMERNADGRFCIRRDSLHSRTGMRCGIDRLRSLVPER